jgi:hypothetical protein
MPYVHKYEVALAYGGPEEGGWYYDTGTPVSFEIPAGHPDFVISGLQVMGFRVADEEEAYAIARKLNEEEHERAKREEDYDYTSVLAYRSTHYAYRVDDTPDPQPYPAQRPHYE